MDQWSRTIEKWMSLFCMLGNDFFDWRQSLVFVREHKILAEWTERFPKINKYITIFDMKNKML